MSTTIMETDASSRPEMKSSQGRLMSLDALRGFTMFWIIGGDSIGHVVAESKLTGLSGRLFEQLDHVAWEGFRLQRTLPAVGTCLLGVFGGMLMRDGRWTRREKVSWLAVGGVGCVVIGLIWGIEFPIIKKLWTSSYVMLAGGLSALFLALFSWLIDIRGWRTWAQPFVWIGMNPIAIYLLSNVIKFDELAARVLGGPVQGFLDARIVSGAGAVAISVGGMFLAVGVCWFLHRRRLYFRL